MVLRLTSSSAVTMATIHVLIQIWMLLFSHSLSPKLTYIHTEIEVKFSFPTLLHFPGELLLNAFSPTQCFFLVFFPRIVPMCFGPYNQTLSFVADPLSRILTACGPILLGFWPPISILHIRNRKIYLCFC